MSSVYVCMQDMELRRKSKQLELLWRGAQSYGAEADVFTGNFADGVCWELCCNESCMLAMASMDAPLLSSLRLFLCPLDSLLSV